MPGGLISTRAAGSAELYARLLWRDEDDRPHVSPVEELALPSGDPHASRHDLRAEEVSRGYVLRGNVSAMTLDALGERVEGFLRSVSIYAGRTEALLETRVSRVADPVVPSAQTICELARCLAGAGLPARFGRVWTPLPPGVCCGLGVRGVDEIGTLLRDDPRWGFLPAAGEVRS